MRISSNWQDYRLLDCSGGERLEAWGKTVLVRPDPQILWDTPKQHSGWKHPDAHYHRSQKGGEAGNISPIFPKAGISITAT